MKAWKKYLTGILALALVVGMVSLLPHIHGEEFDEDEYTFSEEAIPEIEDVPEPDEPEEPEDPEEPEEPEDPEESGENPLDGKLDGGIGEVEAGPLQPAKLTLVPRELTEEEQSDDLSIVLWKCVRNCTVTDDSGESIRIKDCEMVGLMWDSFTVGVDTFTYTLQPSSFYLFAGEVGNQITELAWNKEICIGFKGSGIETVLVTKDGICICGTNMSCEIYRNYPGDSYHHNTVVNATNASQVVLLYDDNGFQAWSDGTYTIKVTDVLNSSRTLSSVSGTANSVYSVSNVSSSSPQFALVEEAE